MSKACLQRPTYYFRYYAVQRSVAFIPLYSCRLPNRITAMCNRYQVLQFVSMYSYLGVSYSSVSSILLRTMKLKMYEFYRQKYWSIVLLMVDSIPREKFIAESPKRAYTYGIGFAPINSPFRMVSLTVTILVMFGFSSERHYFY